MTADADMQAYYSSGREQYRLLEGNHQLELTRTQTLIRRYATPAPGVVYDIGGGSGVYAGWLARLGYTVHLVDAVPLHVEQARQTSAAQPEHPLASAELGDARALTFADASADMVLMLGPLYHLTERADRVQAWREARRVLKPGGVVLGAVISRFASTLGGLFFDMLNDPAFEAIIRQDLIDGQHRNPTSQHGYFTTTYFHRPDEVQAEIEAAGLAHLATLPVEGIGWLTETTDERSKAEWGDPVKRQRLLELVAAVEDEPSLLGMSNHLLGVARRA